MNETESEGGEGGPLNFEIGLGPAAIDKVRVRERGEEIVRLPREAWQRVYSSFSRPGTRAINSTREVGLHSQESKVFCDICMPICSLYLEVVRSNCP